MRVSDVTYLREGETAELSASVDGYRLWYRYPAKFTTLHPGNAFLAACLIPAMARGEALELDDDVPVCPRLLENTDRIQDIFTAWGPVLRVPFSRVAIHARTQAQDTPSEIAGSFFSGGVDGTYTLLRNVNEISHLIFVKGIDMQLTNDELFNEVWETNPDFARHINKPIIPLSSNVRFFAHANGCVWPTYFGAGLASVAYAIGLRKVFVASGMFYADLVPHGSHPLIDPLWSSDVLSVVHDGADVRRIEKLRHLATFDHALRILRVCWQDKSYNCGECEKCLRTMIQLRVLGIDAPTFPPLHDLRAVRRLDIWEDTELDFVRESYDLACEGNDIPLRRALKSCVRRNELRRILAKTDNLLLSGAIKKLRHWRARR